MLRNSPTSYIAFEAGNGTEGMRLTSTGLGIGTSSPATKLDVNGDVTQRNGSGTIIGNIQNSSGWYDFKASANVNGAQISTAAATPIRFLPNGVEAARFDSSGNLGIGTSSPAYKLHVNGNSLLNALEIGEMSGFLSNSANAAIGWASGFTGYTNGTLILQPRSSTATPIVFATGATSASERMRITDTGNLGIGTSSPAEKLDVYSAAGTAAIKLQTASNIAYSINSQIPGVANDGFAIRDVTNSVNRLVIDSSGNLGIGTSSPTTRLTVSGTTTVNTAADATAGLVVKTFGAAGGTQPIANFQRSDAAVNFQIGFNGTSGDNFAGTTTNHNLFFITNNTEKLRLDTSGNLGLGVTPSAWASTVKGFQIGGNGSIADNGAGGHTDFSNNVYYAVDNLNTGARYINNGFASNYYQLSGTHVWRTAASGTAGNTITFSQAMTLDASGNLGVGITSPFADTNYRSVDIRGSTGGQINLGTTSTRVGQISADATNGLTLNTATSTPMRFFINGSERARITSGGYFKASDNGTYTSSTGPYAEFYQSANDIGLIVRNQNASNTGNVIEAAADRNTTNNSYYFFRASVIGVAYRFQVADSGDVTNTNGTYGTISDAKMKTDIVDAGSQWADIKGLRFRKFKMKDDPSGLTQLGVVAQEVEQVSPGLVDEHTDRDAEGNDLGTTTKSVKTSVLLMKAAVALQEAMARIEKLEAEMAALKGA
jgi:hypothetical protein